MQWNILHSFHQKSLKGGLTHPSCDVEFFLGWGVKSKMLIKTHFLKHYLDIFCMVRNKVVMTELSGIPEWSWLFRGLRGNMHRSRPMVSWPQYGVIIILNYWTMVYWKTTVTKLSSRPSVFFHERRPNIFSYIYNIFKRDTLVRSWFCDYVICTSICQLPPLIN